MVHQNLLFGVAFIVLFEILAGFGLISPIVGALLHMVGATVVIFNSARLVRFGEHLHREEESQETTEAGKPRLEAVPAMATTSGMDGAI